MFPFSSNKGQDINNFDPHPSGTIPRSCLCLLLFARDLSVHGCSRDNFCTGIHGREKITLFFICGSYSLISCLGSTLSHLGRASVHMFRDAIKDSPSPSNRKPTTSLTKMDPKMFAWFQEFAEYGGTGCTGPTWTKLVLIWPSWTNLVKLVIILLCFAFLESTFDQLGASWSSTPSHNVLCTPDGLEEREKRR